MQKEADYGLAKGERLRERIDAAWVRLKEIWEEYKDLRERAAQSVTGLHASMRLLREVLGWPDLEPCSGWQQRAVLQHSDGPPVEIDRGRVDRKRCMDLLESEGWMGQVLLPQLIGAPDLSSPFERRLGIELSELISRT